MDEAVSLVDSLAASKAREAPLPLRRSADLRCRRRWMRMLTMSFSRSFAMFFLCLLPRSHGAARRAPRPT